MPKDKGARLLICVKGKKCSKRGSQKVYEAAMLENEKSDSRLAVIPSKCLGLCKHGPAALSQPGKVKHRELTRKSVCSLIRELASSSEKKKKSK